MSSLTSVDFPEPEGAEMMKTVVIPRLRDCSRIFSIAALAARPVPVILRPISPAPVVLERIVLVSRFISWSRKSSFLAAFAPGVEQRPQLPGVDFQAGELFADIAAIGQNRGFLGQSLRVMDALRAFEQVLQALDKPVLETPLRIRSNLFHLLRERAEPGIVPATFPGRSRRLRAHETGSARQALLPEHPGSPPRFRRAVPDSRKLRRTSLGFAGRRSDPAGHPNHVRPQLVESRQILFEQSAIELRRAAVRRGRRKRDPHLHVPAHQPALHQGSHSIFKGIGG